MGRSWWVVMFVLVACDEPLVLGRKSSSQEAPPPVSAGTRPDEAPPREVPPVRAEVAADAAPAHAGTPGIAVFEANDPAFIAIAGDTLMWTDGSGALWSMPSRGGPATELSNQHMAGRPMYGNLGTHAGRVLASRRGALVMVTPPRGPFETLPLDLGSDDLLDLESDGTAIYATSFEDRKAVYRIVDGTRTRLLDLSWPEIAVVGDTLYAASYGNGALVAVKTTGGKVRTIARGLAKVTGFAVDDTAAYAWSEKDKAIHRVELKTGKSKVLLADGLDNTDVLVADGDWVYAYGWRGDGASTFLRVAKDGSRVEVLANDLAAPADIAVDDDAVFVSDRVQNRIIRFDKRAIRPL